MTSNQRRKFVWACLQHNGLVSIMPGDLWSKGACFIWCIIWGISSNNKSMPSIFWSSLCCGRYHYNVADSRLSQHIEKGNEDGLYISCVASCANLWALIMDAGTGFNAQVYELSQSFLHKVSFWARIPLLLKLLSLGHLGVRMPGAGFLFWLTVRCWWFQHLRTCTCFLSHQ